MQCGMLPILAYLNFFLTCGVGIFQSVEYLIGSISYAATVHSMTFPEYEDSEEIEDEEDANNICLHAEENRDVLAHSLYFLTSLVISYAIVEILTGILLIRITCYSKVKSSALKVNRKFWAGFQFLLIFLMVLAFAVHFPLKIHPSAWELTKNVTPFGCLLLWKCSVLLIFTFCGVKCGNSIGSNLSTKHRTYQNVIQDLESQENKESKENGEVQMESKPSDESQNV